MARKIVRRSGTVRTITGVTPSGGRFRMVIGEIEISYSRPVRRRVVASRRQKGAKR